MKVYYKKTILEQIDEEIVKANKEGRDIEKIEITDEEFTNGINSIQQYYHSRIFKPAILKGWLFEYKGIPVYLEEKS